MSDRERYACRDCRRTDLTITVGAKLRKHTANGKRAGSDNPYCSGQDPVRPDNLPPVETDPDTGVPAGVLADTALPCPTEGTHVWTLGECTCGAGQPGYVAPPAPVKGSGTSRGGGVNGFLMGDGAGREKARMADALDVLMADDPPDDGTDRLYKNGRYALPDPLTNNPRTWTRATTMAETISDLYSLNLWRIRMMIIGLARNPWLLEEIIALDNYDDENGTGDLSPKIHKDILNKIGFKAQALAGAKVPANWGTELHRWIERLSRDEITVDDVEPKYRAEVASWAAAMSEWDLSAVPHLIERRVAVPLYGTAGTLDQVDRNHRTRTIRLPGRVVRIKAGEHLIGDVKSGRDLDYGWGEIAIQMSLYAQGIRQGKVAKWDPDAGEDGAWVWEDAGIDPKSVRDDVGVVMHVPIGGGKCTLHWIDLAEGWKAVQLCESVRDWRKIKGLNVPFAIAEVPTEEPAAPPSVRAPSWDERFSAVTTKEQARAVYRQYLAEGGDPDGDEASRLVKMAKNKIRSLTESTA